MDGEGLEEDWRRIGGLEKDWGIDFRGFSWIFVDFRGFSLFFCGGAQIG